MIMIMMLMMMILKFVLNRFLPEAVRMDSRMFRILMMVMMMTIMMMIVTIMMKRLLPEAVRRERRMRKFPILSARKPAMGGVKMKRTGMTALMMAVSWMEMPRLFMWRLRKG